MLRKPRLRRYFRERAGSVAPMFAMLLIPIVGMLGLAGEGSSWFLTQRAAQYSADQAALAAAANNCQPGASCATGGTTFVQEANAVSRRYNFINGVNETTVTANLATAPSPCDTSACYRVAIQRKQPVLLLGVLGFSGNTTLSGGGPAQMINAVAIARRGKSNSEFCITTTSSDPQAFRVNGGPNLNLSTCTVFAPNGGAACNGTSGTMVQGSYVATAGTSASNCGIEQTNPPPLLDPYNALTSNLPNSNSVCNSGTYYTEPKNKNDPPLPASNLLSGSLSKSVATPICGDAMLTGNVTFTGDSVLLIENGRLDLNGKSLTTAAGGSLTIIFSGTNSTTYKHFITGSGTVDYSAPSSGTWSGIALYQDPRLPSGNPVNFTYSGSTPDLNITGLIYAPQADITIDGAIDHATGGLACLTFFVHSALVNGTAAIFQTPTIDCPRAGLDPNAVQTLPKVVMVQ